MPGCRLHHALGHDRVLARSNGRLEALSLAPLVLTPQPTPPKEPKKAPRPASLAVSVALKDRSRDALRDPEAGP